MKAETIVDPRVFLDRTAELLADEARHNLMRGVLHTLIQSPEVYPDYRLFVVAEGDSALAAATITDPYTERANPTSNGINERIGYRQIAEAASYSLNPDE